MKDGVVISPEGRDILRGISREYVMSELCPALGIPVIEKKCRLAGLEPMSIGAESLFVNVGERTNVTGSAAFKRLIIEGDFEAALDVAKQQVENGAHIREDFY